jgi:hypothetical protein
MQEPAPRWIHEILNAPAELIAQVTEDIDRAAELPKAELPEVSWKALSNEVYLQHVYYGVVAAGANLPSLNEVDGLSDIISSSLQKREQLGQKEGRLGYQIAFGRLQMFAAAFTLQLLDAPNITFGHEPTARVSEEYASWAQNDQNSRREDFKAFLRAKDAPLLAHHMLDVEDETSLVGMYVRANMTTVNQLGEGSREVSLAEPEAREAFMEGLLSTLFAVRYNMTMHEMFRKGDNQDDLGPPGE